jgi:hypothetical protein
MFRLGLIPTINLFLLRAAAGHRFTLLDPLDHRKDAFFVIGDGLADGAGDILGVAHTFFPL